MTGTNRGGGRVLAAVAVAGLMLWASSGNGQQPPAADGPTRSLLEQRDQALELAGRLADEIKTARGLVNELQGQIPAGSIVAYGGPCDRPRDIPPGWLFCDGSLYDGGDPKYQRLYDSLGKIWGTGDQPAIPVAEAATKEAPKNLPKVFRVPDLRGRFLRGLSLESLNDPDAENRTDLSGKTVVGNKVGSYQADLVGPHDHPVEEKPHSHTFTVHDKDGGNDHVADGEGNADGTITTTGQVTNLKVLKNVTTETRPKNAAVNYLIKL